MLNIAFLIGNTATHGGIERSTSILANQLLKNFSGNVFVIGFHSKSGDTGGYHWNESITLYSLLRRPKSMKAGIHKALPKLRKYLSKNNIKVLIACGHLYTPLATLACLGTKTKMIYWSHSSFHGERSKIKWFNERVGCFFSESVVCLTKADIVNYKKAKAKNVIQTYNPIDPNLLGIETEYNPDTKKIISVGRLADPKNFETYLLNVASLVLNQNPDYTWHIYGEGKLEQKIRSNIDALGLEEKVFLEGNFSNIYEHYSNYSLMVMTSSYEGFPMTLLEGMAMSLPLVSFDVPTGPNEIIQDGINGYLIPPFDCNRMANRINELIKNRDLRIGISRANAALLNKFKLEETSSKWERLLERMQ